ncbi:FxLYD domain-containing protein [Thermovirga sp.]|uniref:FxLYD domain-containing protein n=1 Tax=Thermovirga sp. TaxID=2699834 RepID=UPI0025D5A221|nr:FxLYD domain-containing protein [Thermovirga sp.]MBO8154786.1 hypothetical protein [Thermovirga sp.]
MLYKRVLVGVILLAFMASGAWGMQISGGFELKNIQYRDSMFGTEFLGEMINKSGKDYSYTMFTLSIYDSDGNLLDATTIIIPHFPNGSTRTFGTQSRKKLPSKIKYKIDPYVLMP